MSAKGIPAYTTVIPSVVTKYVSVPVGIIYAYYRVVRIDGKKVTEVVKTETKLTTKPSAALEKGGRKKAVNVERIVKRVLT